MSFAHRILIIFIVDVASNIAPILIIVRFNVVMMSAVTLSVIMSTVSAPK